MTITRYPQQGSQGGSASGSIFPTFSNFPSASTFGVGIAQAEDSGAVYASDGSSWSDISTNTFDNYNQSTAKFPVYAAYKAIIAPGVTPAWTFSGTANSGDSSIISRATVPGLAESRPDLANGYAIKLKTTGNGTSRATQANLTIPIADTSATESFFVAAVFFETAPPSTIVLRWIGYDGTNAPTIAYQQASWRAGLNFIILDGASASPALSGNQTYNRFELDTAAGGGSITCYVLDILHFRKAAVVKYFDAKIGKMVSNFEDRFQPKVIFEYDDAFSSIYTIAFPLHKSANIIGSIPVIADRIGTAGYCTEAQLLEMMNAGWALTVHGDYQHTSFSDYDALYADVKHNQDYVKSIGGNYLSYVYPGGAINSSFSSQVLEDLGFYTGRTTSVGRDLISNILGEEDRYRTKTYTLNDTNYSNITGFINLVIKSCSTLRLYGHKVAATVTDPVLEISTANLTTIINYVVSAKTTGTITDVTVETLEKQLGLRPF